MSTYDSTVNSLYLAFYGRPADPAGLAFWARQLAANEGKLDAITQAFAMSEEAQVRFGADTVAERIAETYQQLFNRAPEQSGLDFWTNAIEQGHATLADVSISILQGAQSGDASLAALRQQAVEAFTARVASEGSEYSGYASIEAARILVRAVTPDTNGEDLAALVQAAVSFADTATSTPQVVEAIAANTTLLALFDTPRGVSEPVNLAKALADTARAAAGDPSTLESLLRGGGMDKVLKAMPARATLQDVVDALAKGGLPAAVEVVYPSTPSAPAYQLGFLGVTQGEGDTVTDHVTSKEVVDVTFGYRGNDLGANQKYEYRINGGEWRSEYILVDRTANTVVLQQVDLTQGEAPVPPALAGRLGILGVAPADLLSNIELRAVRSDGSVIGAVQQQIVHDRHAEMPFVSVATSETAGHFDGHPVTAVPALEVDGIEPGARVEYQLVPRYTFSAADSDDKSWSTGKPVFGEDGEYTVRVRQTDVSGNVSAVRTFTFTLDRETPQAPIVTLLEDTGIPGDGITDIAKVRISGLETSSNTAWEYRIGEGEWTFGERNDGTGSAVLDLGKHAGGDVTVQVRQFDAAGHVGGASDPLSFSHDATPPDYAIGFASVEQGAFDRAPEDNTTNVGAADVTFTYTGGELAEGLHFEYTTDGGKNWRSTGLDVVDGVVTLRDVDLTAGTPAGAAQPASGDMAAGSPEDLLTTVQLRVADGKGYVYASASETLILDRFAAVPEPGLAANPVAQHFGQDSVGRTNLPTLEIGGLEEGAVVEYLDVSNLSGATKSTWTGTMPELMDGTHTLRVRQRDEAGNLSAAQEITFTLDRDKPGAPALSLQQDSGMVGDGITNVAQVAIDGLEASPEAAWEYRIGDGKWIFGHRNDSSGKAVLDVDTKVDGPVTVQVRQFDAAGNVGQASQALTLTIDTTAPAGSFGFAGVERTRDLASGVTDLANAAVSFKYDVALGNGERLEYRLDDGAWMALDGKAYDPATGLLAIDVDFSTGDHEVAVRAVDASGNATEPFAMLVDSTANDGPTGPASMLTALHVSFSKRGSSLVMLTSPNTIASVGDKSTLSLDSMSTGAPVPAGSHYFDGPGFQANGIIVSLAAMPDAGLYRLGWKDGSFKTTNDGYLGEGSALFAGGAAGAMFVEGFVVKQAIPMYQNVHQADSAIENTAFIGVAGVDVDIYAGGGNDLIADNGSRLTVFYEKFATASHDLFLGFDSGDDRIMIDGPAAALVDDNGDGELLWAKAAGPGFAIGRSIEAVKVATAGFLSAALSINLDINATTATLNASLDISALQAGDDLLILAGEDDHGILYYYKEETGNGTIDYGEITTVAAFADGAVDSGDIVVVGGFGIPG